MLRVVVIAHTGARQERVEWVEDATLAVWVRARPVEGQANAAIETALAAMLGVRPRQVRIVAGQTSRRKIVEVDISDLDVLRARLVAHAMRSG
jgi:uncharacterized protein YggU (UPF0235/DUF167 family)